MVQNCINCGAPIDTEHTKCPYCGTPYNYDGFNAELKTKTLAEHYEFQTKSIRYT